MRLIQRSKLIPLLTSFHSCEAQDSHVPRDIGLGGVGLRWSWALTNGIGPFFIFIQLESIASSRPISFL